MQLSKTLKQLIADHELNVPKLSKSVQISPKTIHNWLAGQAPRDLNQVRKVAKFFNVSLDYLLFAETKDRGQGFEKYTDEINAGIYEVILRRVKK